MPAGFESTGGFAREAITFTKVWPSASPALVTTPIPLISEDVQTQLEQAFLVTRDSRSVATNNKVIRQWVTGGFLSNVKYEGIEAILSAAMGQEAPRLSGTLMPEELVVGTVYRHVFEIDRDLKSDGWKAGDGFLAGPTPVGDGLVAGQRKIRRGTFAVTKNSVVWESKSCMINSLTLQVSPSGVTMQAELVGHSITYGSTVNAGVGNLICTEKRILFNECRLFVRTLDGSPFNEATDLVPQITGFQMQINNNLRGINTRDTKTRMDEPERSGAVVVSGGFAIPRYSSFDRLAANKNNNQVIIKLECLGDLIPGGGGERFRLNLWFPSVTLTGAEAPLNGAGQILQNYSYLALNGGQPAGFPVSTFGGPVTAELVNANGNHTLLD